MYGKNNLTEKRLSFGLACPGLSKSKMWWLLNEQQVVFIFSNSRTGKTCLTGEWSVALQPCSELQLRGGTCLFSSPKLQVQLKDVGLRMFFQMNSPPAEHLLEKKSKTFPHFSCGCQFFLRSPFFQAPSGEMHRKTLTPGGFWKECRSLRQREFFHFLNNQ